MGFQSNTAILAVLPRAGSPCYLHTVENYEFALTIEPDNELVKERLQEVKQLADKGLPTVPSTIGREKRTNIFLLAKTADEFENLRKLKDRFG